MGAFVVISLGYIAGGLVIVLNAQRTFMIYALAGLVVNVALNLALLPHFSYVAAAWATLATDVVVTGLTLALVSRRLQFVPSLKRVARAAVAAAAMGLAVWLAVDDVAVWVLAIAAAVGYTVLCLALGAVRPGEIRVLRGADV